MQRKESSFLIPDFDEYYEDNIRSYIPYDARSTKPSVKDSENNPPLISYQYISIEATEYCFNHNNLDLVDFESYFKRLKSISPILIKDIISRSNHELKFHYVELRKKPKLETLIRKEVTLSKRKDDWPLIYQFALYTNERVPTKEKNKCPRVFFMMSGGIFYILLLDVYHQISPTNY